MNFFNMLFIVLVQSSQKFGTELGENSGVVGYSNEGATFETSKDNYYEGVYTGTRYQCVEYARRWLVATQNLTFVSVKCASDIWHLNSLENPYDEEKKPLNRIQNGSKCKPNPGDILIYKRALNNPAGHVAIITEVDNSSIKIAEQNWDSEFWPGDYSRVLKMVEINKEFFIVEDDYVILGWLVYKGKHEKSCFDTKCRTCSLPDLEGICGYN